MPHQRHHDRIGYPSILEQGNCCVAQTVEAGVHPCAFAPSSDSPALMVSWFTQSLPSVHWFNIECPDLFLDAVLEFLLAV